jgi:hypothetical protein
MIVFAGGTGTPNENDTWALSLGATPTWTQLAPSGPPQPGSRRNADPNHLLYGG